jgi:NAD(P)-dependent dehydrogenase (short-subunit alcohol dehydrogenase family)
MNIQSFEEGRGMAWSTKDIPDQSGRAAVVTGANGGLGLETARALAGAGAHVVMAARDQAKAAAARDDILATHANASLELVELDLGSLRSVADAASEIASRHPKIDLLINNAGLMGIPERKTEDGFEMQFGVDHLGHWAFTAKLLGPILAAPAARVVTVTSTAHHMGRRVNPDNPHLHGRYGPWRAYGQAKLANFHFGLGLQDRFAAAGVKAQSLIAHPGLSHTELQVVSAQEEGGFWARFFKVMAARTGMSARQGSLSQLRAATDPSAKGGEFYGPLWVNNGPPVRKPIFRRLGMGKSIDVLWKVSERETGIALEVPAVSEAPTPVPATA